jgi:VWFA-related protein
MRIHPRFQFVPLVIVISAATLIAGRQTPQRPRFVTGVDTVSATVTVHQGNLPVTGLKAEDFEITDNGVPQTPDFVTDDSLPIDLTLVMDASGSMLPMVDQLKADVFETAKMLHDDDRVRLITFTDIVVESSPFLPASELAIDHVPPPGSTSIYHAVAAALMRTRSPDRHELVVLFTDGGDTSSTIGGATVLDVARRSDAVLDIFIVLPAPGALPGALPNIAAPDQSNQTRGGWLPFVPEYTPATHDWLDKSATTTGGQLDTIIGEAHMPGGLKTVIDDMHTSYIVYFTPKDVAKPGWHDLKFKLKRPGDFSIRARKGYLGPAK